MEKLRRYGPGLAILVSGLMVALLVPGPFRVVAMILTFIAIFFFGTRSRDPDDESRYGPGA